MRVVMVAVMEMRQHYKSENTRNDLTWSTGFGHLRQRFFEYLESEF
jgi:hypothetical protein